MFFADLLAVYPVTGRFHVLDSDSLLFLRYYEQSLLQDRVVQEDSYGCFPSVKKTFYPPLHLRLLLGVTHLYFALAGETDVNADYIIGWLPPLVGWLTMIFAVMFAWFQTKNPGLTFMVAFCCIPGMSAKMTFSFLRIDYHFLNSFFISAWLFFSWAFSSCQKRWQAIIGAVSVALFMCTWHGTPIFFGLVTLYAIFLWLTNAKIKSSFLEYASFTMLVGSALTAMLVLKIGSNSFSISTFGWFQVTAVFSAGLLLHLLNYLQEAYKVKVKVRVGIFSVLVLLALTAGAVVFPEQLYEGLGFFTANDPIMSGINELKAYADFSSLIKNPMVYAKGMLLLGIAFLFIPALIFWGPQQIFAGAGKIYRDWFLILGFLSMFSVRYGRWLGPMPGLFAGVALYWFIRNLIRSLPSSDRGSFIKLSLAFLPLAIAVFLATYPFYKEPEIFAKDDIEAFAWIRENTPETSGYKDRNQPEYGILSFWDEGNKLAYYARRPVIVNNALWGYKKMAAIFSARSEIEAVELCEKYKIRYVYIRFRHINDQVIDLFDMYKNKPDATDDSFSFTTDYVKPPEPRADYLDTFHCWLANQLAILPAGNFSEPSSRFRLVYSAKQQDRFTEPKILLYEMVEGAKIKGKVDPESEITISLACKFDKVSQIYLRKVVAGSHGKFSLTVPYATGTDLGRVVTEEAYKIAYYQNGQMIKGLLQISENDVLVGATLGLDSVEVVK
jgi:asparagine N-glycosylation enzyme membrane subunit Stt3